MNEVKILDCTLRDGGFINDWNFGRQTIFNVFSRLVASKIDYIELGFINESYGFDLNRTIMPHTKYLKNIFDAKIKTNAKLLAMVIMGEATIEAIGDRSETIIDGIRVVFKKNGINEAFEFATLCRQKGYEIFLQPASITDYSDEDMIALVEKANIFMPHAFYMVDTYGLLNKTIMFHYANLIDQHLSPKIKIGYHSHNNFQLSYATAMEFIECKKNHDIIVDSTLFGMGKTTGNLNTELIVDYMNKHGQAKYDNAQILEAIDSEIIKIKRNADWGYSLNGFIAASNDCHPKYVSYLLEKRSLSVGSINKILQKIDKNNRTGFNKTLIEKLFLNYQSIDVDDCAALAALTNELQGRELLLLATGASLEKERQKILSYIEEKKPVIIGINHDICGYPMDYCFINNAKRFSQMAEFVNSQVDIKLIATSNVVSSARRIEYPINYARVLVDGDIKIVADNAALMLIKLLAKCGIGTVAVAGFDGFCEGETAYVGNYRSFNDNKDISTQNRLISDALERLRKDIAVKLITGSQYEDSERGFAVSSEKK